MRYQRLFQVRIRHAYYPGGCCTDLRLEPSQRSGWRELRRHRLVAKALPDGLEIVAPVRDGRPLVDFAAGTAVAFELRVTTPEFVLFTDLRPLQGFARPVFTAGDRQDAAATLADGALPLSPELLASVEIRSISASWLQQPPCFTLTFEPRQTLWVYYILTARPELEAPAIVDGAPDPEPLHFTHSRLTSDEPGLDRTDPMGWSLLARHPDRACHRLISQRLVACRKEPRRQLALHAGELPLISELPNPSMHRRSSLELDDDAPQDALFQVVNC